MNNSNPRPILVTTSPTIERWLTRQQQLHRKTFGRVLPRTTLTRALLESAAIADLPLGTAPSEPHAVTAILDRLTKTPEVSEPSQEVQCQ